MTGLKRQPTISSFCNVAKKADEQDLNSHHDSVSHSVPSTNSNEDFPSDPQNANSKDPNSIHEVSKYILGFIIVSS